MRPLVSFLTDNGTNTDIRPPMISLLTFNTPLNRCSYLPDRQAQLRHEIVGQLSVAEYQQRLKDGWRRFGHSLFKPACPACRSCRSLRVPVSGFKPDRSQKRAAARNDGPVALTIGPPSVSREKLALYDKFHAFQHEAKAWPEHGPKDAADYVESFVDNPFPTQEWAFRLDGQLVGVGYVDQLPEGLSAIYFYYDPDERERSLGVWNVLSTIREAARLRLPHVYLGYYVEGCRSLEYKGRYRPNEALDGEGRWSPFLR